jgi:secreted Zn-dependent insulinase-like peptidase
MLKQDGPKEWIFEEYKDILSMNFRFKDKESPRTYVSNVVHNLHVSQNFHVFLLSILYNWNSIKLTNLYYASW